MDHKQTPLVSIVLVNWNGLEDTKVCLEYIRKQTYSNIKIIVVDNGSKDGSVDYLETIHDITLLKNSKNLGFTGGHITGYTAVEGEYVLLLNNDAVMDTEYVERGVAYLQMDSSIAVLGGRAYQWNENNPLLDKTNSFYAYQDINPITAEGIFRQVDEGIPRDVNNVSGSCVFIRRSVINEVGYLHDPFFAYYEESDLFARIKRAGHRIVYHPELVIWHANGKTAARKGSSFSFYMMMRNRFRFAVRNFDGWALRRFLKFYVKMGVVSSCKALLPKDAYMMDRAYARAFWRNVFTGWLAGLERRQLARQLPANNYTQQIIREQTTISIITTHTNPTNLIPASEHLAPWDELLVVTREPQELTRTTDWGIASRPARLCVVRDFLNVPAENIGVASAKGEWLLITPSDSGVDELIISDVFTRLIYQARQLGASVIADPGNAHYLIRRQFIADAGGFDKALSPTENLEVLVRLASKRGTLLGPEPSTIISELVRQAVLKADYEVNDAESARITENFIERVIRHQYRLQQGYYLFRWLLSPRINVRLKLGRLKNLLLSALHVDRVRLATELKHIRNEVQQRQASPVSMDERKASERMQLEDRIMHPEETVVFIITRDRLSTLKQLLDWLEHVGFKRIVFIDNDSALPPLMDYLSITPYQTIETASNVGHTVPWTSSIVKLLAPGEFYIVTDPDVIPAEKSVQAVRHLYELHQRYPDHLKIGFGLNIDDLPEAYELKSDVIRWEEQFWKHQLAEGVYEAGLDTTFALYKPYTYRYFIHPSLRTGSPYTARHLPWYNVSHEPSDEDIFYRIRADQNVNTWDKGKLPERYVKELKRQGK